MQIDCLNWNTYESKGGHHCYLCQDNRYKPSLPGEPGGVVILQVLFPNFGVQQNCLGAGVGSWGMQNEDSWAPFPEIDSVGQRWAQGLAFLVSDQVIPMLGPVEEWAWPRAAFVSIITKQGFAIHCENV